MSLTKVTNEVIGLSTITPDKLTQGGPNWDLYGLSAVAFVGDGSGLTNVFPAVSVVEVNDSLFTLLPEHNNCTLVFNNASSVVLEAPSVYTPGHRTGIIQHGTNPVTITGGVNNVFGYNKTNGQYSKAILQFVNEVEGWVASGDLAPSVALYSLSANKASVNEGSVVTIQLSTVGVSDGNVPYTVLGTINTADLSAGSAGMTGNFNLVSGLASIVFGLSADRITEGTELINLTLDNGQASISVPVNDTSANPVPQFTQVATEQTQILALSGTDLFVVGINSDGKLGLNSLSNRNTFTKVTIPTNATWTNVNAGYYNSFALSGTDLYVTGEDYQGASGLGISQAQVSTFTKIPGNFLKINSSLGNTVALSTSGDLFFTGISIQSTYSSTFTRVVNTSHKFTNFTSSGRNILALSGNDLYVIGLNQRGELGLGDKSLRSTYTKILGNWTNIVGGNAVGGAACSFALSGTDLYSTGSNDSGQLGLNDTIHRSTFTKILGNWIAVDIQDSYGNHTLALSSSKDLFVCGYNISGQLGTGDTVTRSSFTRVGSAVFGPTIIANPKFDVIVAGRNHSLALSGNLLYASGAVGPFGTGSNTTVFTLLTSQ